MGIFCEQANPGQMSQIPVYRIFYGASIFCLEGRGGNRDPGGPGGLLVS